MVASAGSSGRRLAQAGASASGGSSLLSSLGSALGGWQGALQTVGPAALRAAGPAWRAAGPGLTAALRAVGEPGLGELATGGALLSAGLTAAQLLQGGQAGQAGLDQAFLDGQAADGADAPVPVPAAVPRAAAPRGATPAAVPAAVPVGVSPALRAIQGRWG
jgi:hypothetical protein